MQKIIVHLVDGNEFQFLNEIPTLPDVVERMAKTLKRRGYIVLGEDEVMLFADKILWIKKEFT